MYFFSIRSNFENLNKKCNTVSEKFEEKNFKDAYFWLKKEYNLSHDFKIKTENSFYWLWDHLDNYDIKREKRFNKKYCNNQYNLIVLKINDDDINFLLRSDFEAWHMVLNKWEIDDIKWSDIFDDNALIKKGFKESNHDTIYQYVVPFIKKEWVIDVIPVHQLTAKKIKKYKNKG